MQKLTETIIHSDFKNRIITEVQLKRLLSGSNQRRYGLVHRAMQAGELRRIRRGIYILNNSLRDTSCNPFALAQAIYPSSYISFETALSWHGWIPERVVEIASVVSTRKKNYFNIPEFGIFTFSPLAITRFGFLRGVMRHQVDQQTFLLAQPLRALFDLVCQRKMEWSGLSALTHGLRIDETFLLAVDSSECHTYISLYKHQRTRHFIEKLSEYISTRGADD